MAFGKKKDNGPQPEAAVAPADTHVPVPVAAVAMPETPGEPNLEPPDGDPKVEAVLAPSPAIEHAFPADLLDAFQAVEEESADRVLLLELAGIVEFDDLLEDLQTVAVALGITLKTHVYDDDDDDDDDDAYDELAA